MKKVLLIGVVGVILMYVCPWKQWAGQALVYAAEAKGYKNVGLTLSEVSASGITLENIVLGGENPINIAQVKLAYFPLTIAHAEMEFQGGKIRVQDVIIPLSGGAVDATLQVENVPMDALMNALTGKRASATGLVSGKLPLTYLPEGNVILHQGQLSSKAPGKIAMQPEVIPGDNEQVALVREVMQNLHYDVLAVNMDTDAQGKLAVQLHVEGSNPDMAGGQQVKLNVNLSGDVLELIQQSLLTVDPKKYLEQ